MEERQAAITIIAPSPQDNVAPAELPTFSVVIPAYQAALTVPAAIASALGQTSPPREVIVVDDGSTDDLSAAVAPFANEIRLVRKPNGGAASARNAGIGVATAEFAAFLDADDLFHPRRLEALGELARSRPDLDILVTDAIISVAGVRRSNFFADTPFATREQRKAIFDTCFVTGWPAVRLERLRAIGGFDENLKIAEDWDCYLRLILDGAIAGCVPEPYYEYRRGENTLTADRVRSLQARVEMLRNAMGRSQLTRDERAALRRALRRHGTRAAVAEAGAVLAGRSPRRRLLELAASPGVMPRARARMAFAAAVPGLGRRIIPTEAAPAEGVDEKGAT